jgi:hypothetical protein
MFTILQRGKLKLILKLGINILAICKAPRRMQGRKKQKEISQLGPRMASEWIY